MAACFCSPEIWKCWEKSGKHEFLKLCQNLISFSNDGILTDSKELRGAVYDLLWNAIRGQIKLEHAASVAKILSDTHKGVVSLLADTFSIIDVEIVCLEEKSNRDNFLSLLTLCLNFIPDNILKERLENDTLESINAINNKLVYSQKYVKLKTKLFYKQQKFNLLREESEGYSKLVTELLQGVHNENNKTQNRDNTAILQNIRSLVGGFNLDPNRVLDVILEAFENAPSMADLFVPLIQGYMTDPITICDILGFKFKFYKDDETVGSLYDVAALLLKHSLINLNDVYPHLSPEDAEIIKVYKKEVTDARQYARKLSMIILSDKPAESNADENDEKQNVIENNQKIGVCRSLLKVGDWTHAQQLMDRLPPFTAVADATVSMALCALISDTIQHIYTKYAQPAGAKGQKGSKSERSVNDIEDLDEAFFKMVSYLGPYLSRDPVLMWKLIRLSKVAMKKIKTKINPFDKDNVDELYVGIISMTDEVLLPSLSLLPHNPCITEELWTLISMFQYEIRYRLYGRWKNYSYAIHPSLIRTKANVIERGKYIMKRLSKENVKPSGRQLGKLSHGNPGVIFEYVLSQIQKYDNFIGPVVDSFKYLSSLSYDMLTYVMIEALANPEKERMKHDGANLSLWIQSLASFSGSICRKYNIELAGFIQYVINQLKAGKSYDLLILREVLQKMTGIEVSDEITYDQLEAQAGGELLRAEGGYFSQVRNTKKSSQRLKDTFLDHNLVAPLCILIAQQRLCVIFKDGKERHLKLIGKLYDQCQDTLVQLGNFLANHLSSEDYLKHLPTLKAMVQEYHLTPDSAFFLYRPMCQHAIMSKFDELRKLDRSLKQSSSTSLKTQRFVEASESVLEPLVEDVKSLHHIKVWDDISPQFYVSFWTLSMYDLDVPHASYEKEINKVKMNMASLEDNKDMVSAKRKKESERYQILMDKLKDEVKKQQDHCNRVMARLKQQCQGWFPKRSTKNETITQFLQLCIFPRCCFTASDAMYCAKFVLVIHNLKTENFSTLLCYDRVFSEITYTLTSCTESEASRYGRFLCCMLSQVIKWHSDKSVYEKECGDYPGFVTVLRASGAESSNKADQLDFENFRHVCHKWQYKLTKAVVACLESKDYTQIRNTLILLTKILPYFPLVENLGNVLEKRVDKIRVEEKEKRPDIYALAMGYSGQLKARKPSMIPEAKFHTKEAKASAPINVKKEPGTVDATDSAQVQVKTEPDVRVNGENIEKKERITSSSSKSDLHHSKKTDQSSKSMNKDKESKEDKIESKSRKIKEEKNHRSSKSHREEKDKAHSIKIKEENGREEKTKSKKDKEESKRDGKSKGDEKEQRASSVTSSSSQGSANVPIRQELSPVRDESEREPKRRKMEGSASSTVSKNRERKDKDRGQRNEKKREMPDIEREDHEVKRHKEEESGTKFSKSPRNNEEIGKERKSKSSKSSQDGERKRSKEKKSDEKPSRKENKEDGRKEHREDGKENKREKKSKKDKEDSIDGLQKHRSKPSP